MAQAVHRPATRDHVRLRPGWARGDHPVYRLERSRQAASPVLRSLQSGFLPLILASAGLAAVAIAGLAGFRQAMWSLEGAAMSALGALLAVLVFIQAVVGAAANILVVAQTAPLISGELELQSWGLLRATTLPLREIVLAKLAAALAQLRSALAGLVILRAASTVTGLLFLAFVLLRGTFYHNVRALEMWLHGGMWVMPVGAGLLFLLWYTAQPVLQFSLNGALGLLASTFTRSRGHAVVMGLAARLVTWVAALVLNAGLIYGLFFVLGSWSDPRYAPLRAFRSLTAPTPQQQALVFSGVGALYVLATLLLQVGFTIGALRLAQRRARWIGG